jgi:hypothetical protein
MQYKNGFFSAFLPRMRTKAINQFKSIPHGLGLNLIVVATGLQNSVAAAATATSLVPIVDSAGVVDPASVANPDLVEEVEADLKATGPNIVLRRNFAFLMIPLLAFLNSGKLLQSLTNAKRLRDVQ